MKLSIFINWIIARRNQWINSRLWSSRIKSLVEIIRNSPCHKIKTLPRFLKSNRGGGDGESTKKWKGVEIQPIAVDVVSRSEACGDKIPQ